MHFNVILAAQRGLFHSRSEKQLFKQQAVADSRQRMVLQLGGGAKG